jgi:hypothetical protein
MVGGGNEANHYAPAAHMPDAMELMLFKESIPAQDHKGLPA